MEYSTANRGEIARFSHIVSMFLLSVFLEFRFRVERLATDGALVSVFVIVVAFDRHECASHYRTVNNAALRLGPQHCSVGLFRRSLRRRGSAYDRLRSHRRRGRNPENTASAAARSGLDGALVEKRSLGGPCLTRGCDPSKTLVHRANVVEGVRRAERFGIEAEITGVDFSQIVSESSDPFDEKAAHTEDQRREAKNVTVYGSEAEFVDERTLSVGDEEIAGENVVAAGSRPVIPSAIDGIEDVRENEFDLAPIASKDRPRFLGAATQTGIKFALREGHLLKNPGDEDDMRLVGAYDWADEEGAIDSAWFSC